LLSLDHKDQWTETMLFETSIPALISNVQSNEFVF
jgi:hypothetical protein